jgi:hypothetical protein
MLLLTPIYTPSPSSPLNNLLVIPVPNPTPEVAASFGAMHKLLQGETRVSFTMESVRLKFLKVLRAIASKSGAQTPYLKVVATLKEFTLSRFANGAEDDEALAALQKLLLAATIQHPPKAWPFPVAGEVEEAPVFALAAEDEYFLKVASKMFASFGAQVLNKELESFTPHQRLNQGELLKDICKRLNVALRLRGVMELLLEGVARVAPIDVEKCVRLTLATQGMIGASRERGFDKVLFTDHFRGALAFLRRNNKLLDQCL